MERYYSCINFPLLLLNPCLKNLHYKSGCLCKAFKFIPSRPEEFGEFWLPKRRDFDAAAYRAMCRCKHNHEKHHAHPPPFRCKAPNCRCPSFESVSACVACDLPWTRHETFLETEQERKSANRQVGGLGSFVNFLVARPAIVSSRKKV
ncbi:unnamed protein product [Protopolystoma xenopodis]|uniref:Uncharacterized protein n=1 Tax=Protopolystoma xenopodis TaxID=117903 RepID=A0A448WT43_9PLAT|nr:unnamed protein product [Protopolystoma xenopodis]